MPSFLPHERSIVRATSATLIPSIVPAVPAFNPSAKNISDLLAEAQNAAGDATHDQARTRVRPIPHSELLKNAPGSALQGEGEAAWSGLSEIKGLVDIVDVASDVCITPCTV